MSVQRLAYIRYLQQQGVLESNRPYPLAAKAVSTFHDAAEHLLGLACEHLNINPPKKADFMEYWSFLQPGLPAGTELPSKKAMQRMNNVRVLHKHQGTYPSSQDIEQIRADVSTFLIDTTSLVFNVDLQTVSLANLVAGTVAEPHLGRAIREADAHNYTEAIIWLAVAFDELVNDYLQRKHSSSAQNPFEFGPRLRSQANIQELLAPLDDVLQAAEAMQRALRVLTLGIDYPSYARFRLLTPSVTKFNNGTWRAGVSAAHQEFGRPEFEFCEHFVIESALRLAQLDYDINLWKRNSELGKANSGTIMVLHADDAAASCKADQDDRDNGERAPGLSGLSEKGSCRKF